MASFAALASAAPFQSWTERRDEAVERQSLDFSCGLASLATVLRQYHGRAVSEGQLLERLEGLRGISDARVVWGERGVALSDLALLANSYGLKAAGLWLSARDLARLTRPVIVSLRVRGAAHFAVLRGMNETGRVFLADPAQGNRWVAPWRFRRWFNVGADGRGSILLLSDKDRAPGNRRFYGYRERHVLLRGPSGRGLFQSPLP